MRFDVSADRKVGRADEAQRAITDDCPALKGKVLSQSSFCPMAASRRSTSWPRASCAAASAAASAADWAPLRADAACAKTKKATAANSRIPVSQM